MNNTILPLQQLKVYATLLMVCKESCMQYGEYTIDRVNKLISHNKINNIFTMQLSLRELIYVLRYQIDYFSEVSNTALSHTVCGGGSDGYFDLYKSYDDTIVSDIFYLHDKGLLKFNNSTIEIKDTAIDDIEFTDEYVSVKYKDTVYKANNKLLIDNTLRYMSKIYINYVKLFSSKPTINKSFMYNFYLYLIDSVHKSKNYKNNILVSIKRSLSKHIDLLRNDVYNYKKIRDYIYAIALIDDMLYNNPNQSNYCKNIPNIASIRYLKINNNLNKIEKDIFTNIIYHFMSDIV